MEHASTPGGWADRADGTRLIRMQELEIDRPNWHGTTRFIYAKFTFIFSPFLTKIFGRSHSFPTTIYRNAVQ